MKLIPEKYSKLLKEPIKFPSFGGSSALAAKLSFKLPQLKTAWSGGGGVVGLDTGASSIKVIRATGDKPPLSIQYGSVHPRQVGLEEIKKEMEKGGLGKKGAALCIADERTEIHEFKLPELSSQELAAAVDWEVKKTVPSPEFVYHDVLTYPVSGGYEVQCIVASRDIVNSRYEEGENLGIKPKFLETESSAIFSCAQYLNPTRTLDKVAIFDLGYSSFRLIFIHHGRVSFTRSLYFGISTLLKQASEQMSLELSALEAIFPMMGKLNEAEAAKPEAVAVTRFLQESLYTLCEEFTRSEFFGKEQKNLDAIDEVLLCGGGACVPSVVEYLRQHLPDKKIDTLDPFKTAESVPSGIDLLSGPAWACAVGLSLRGGT